MLFCTVWRVTHGRYHVNVQPANTLRPFASSQSLLACFIFLSPKVAGGGKIASLLLISRSKENQIVRMMRPLPNYLKMHRKKAGYTQTFLGMLLGGKDGSEISRYERGIRKPGPINLAMLEIIFGVSRHELFPGIVEVDPGQIHQRVITVLNIGCAIVRDKKSTTCR